MEQNNINLIQKKYHESGLLNLSLADIRYLLNIAHNNEKCIDALNDICDIVFVNQALVNDFDKIVDIRKRINDYIADDESTDETEVESD